MRVLPLSLLLIWPLAATLSAQTVAGSKDGSTLVQTAGGVQFQAAGTTAWLAATNGLALKPGDRIRTQVESRAAVQFSDRSVMRLGENTVLEIQPPRASEEHRFRLPRGILYFFHRDKPSGTEFETPVASGAIRGTEFVLSCDGETGATHLGLLDGAVELTAADATVYLNSGEQVKIERGKTPQKSPLLEVQSLVQWALYYPAVVSPDDFVWTYEDLAALKTVFVYYRSGDPLAALDAIAQVPRGSENRELFRSALALAGGFVDRAEQGLSGIASSHPVAQALNEMIFVSRGGPTPIHNTNPTTASEWLARSYLLQAQFELKKAHAAAQEATKLASEFGYGFARLAELELALEHRSEAQAAAEHAMQLSPKLAHAQALLGFIHLEDHRPSQAAEAFERAIALDAALGNAWLGLGIAQLQLNQRREALRSFQTAATLQPRNALARAYLGKAFSHSGEAQLAAKDFRLAKELDPGDPTAFLYSALHQWQQNRPNTAMQDLERSTELNDFRQIYRSRLLLDRDRSVRSANLASVYREAGLSEASLRAAAQAATDDYANFSSHLFLANSLQSVEDPNHRDLRFESARFSELLVANLLAPAGAGNLSQLLSQQEHLSWFEMREIATSLMTEYRSSGDWRQYATLFGNVEQLSYALDFAYESQHGQEINDWQERKDASVQIKHRIDSSNEYYFQAGLSDSASGDVTHHYDPASGHAVLRVDEDQVPNLFLGWHHRWSAEHHTLLLFSRLTDSFALRDDGVNLFHLQPSVASPIRISSPAGGYGLNLDSDFTLYSSEVQHIWQTEHHALVLGGRYQAGDVQSDSTLTRPLTGIVSSGGIDEPLTRANGYIHYQARVSRSLTWIGGLSYDHLDYPRNSELAPLSSGQESADLLAPKTGFLLRPWKGGFLRGAYSQSLGGLFFDNSVRLEPSHVAGFIQSFRSIAPESMIGLVPGTKFETINGSLDQVFPSQTYIGVGLEWLRSEGDRVVGVTEGPLPSPLPGAVSSTRQTVDFRERNLSAYVVQLLGSGLSVGARYRLSEAELATRLPDLPSSTIDLNQAEQSERSVLHQTGLTVGYQHPAGFFSQWDTQWYRQHNFGYVPTRSSEDFWQHNLWIGFRPPRRHFEVRMGMLNLTDQDYRLSPLNQYLFLPRGRTLAIRLQIHF